MHDILQPLYKELTSIFLAYTRSISEDSAEDALEMSMEEFHDFVVDVGLETKVYALAPAPTLTLTPTPNPTLTPTPILTPAPTLTLTPTQVASEKLEELQKRWQGMTLDENTTMVQRMKQQLDEVTQVRLLPPQPTRLLAL